MCLPCATCQGSEVDRPRPRGHQAAGCAHPRGASLSVGQEGRVSPGTRFISQDSVLGTGCGLPRAEISEAPGAQAERLTPQIAQPVTTLYTRRSTCSTATPTGTSGPSGSSNAWCGRPASASPGDCGEATWFLECRSQPLQGGRQEGTGESGGLRPCQG